MKKSKQLVISVAIVAALLVLAGVVWFFFGALPAGAPKEETTAQTASGKAVTVFDGNGEPMITLGDVAGIYDNQYWAYLEIVISEAEDILSKRENCDAARARELLFTNGYQIHTSFDPSAYDALETAGTYWEDVCDTAGAITNLQGDLLAVYSGDVSGKQINYSQARRSPHSAFKPLSVYAPAIEKGIANWSTLYPDTPYKQVQNEDGQLRDWPANASGAYSGQNLPVYEALRKSLNTVAVKCLADVGVTESMKFLQENFGIPLKEESYVAKTYGEEEVIGNIALGNLETGITPVEMAGYYQIFANGGVYTKPAGVQKLCAEDGTAVYVRNRSSKQVISETTADLMNKLLQGVVTDGGTGEGAQCYGVEIAGKTGTGDGHADNWFIGVTPGYSLAMWHGKNDTNEAATMFADAVNRLYLLLPDENTKFITHQNLHQVAYCARSGKAVSSGCTLMDIGYFEKKDALPLCDICNTVS